MIKKCEICGVESKALHLHMKKHENENKKVEVKETYNKDGELKKVEANGVQIFPPVAEPIQPEGQDIPLTEDMAEAPAEKEELTNVNSCEYFLELQFNGETLQCYTNNLDISIQSFARPALTEMFVKIAKNNQGDPFIKKLTLVQAKQLFSDPQNREIFLELYYGLYGRPQTEQRLNNL
jgi:hypothetical protein